MERKQSKISLQARLSTLDLAQETKWRDGVSSPALISRNKEEKDENTGKEVSNRKGN